MEESKEKLPEGYTHLFSTLTGSHAWNMNHPGSDKDLFVCYAAPSTEFLIGRTHNKSHYSKINGVDRTSTEIGKVVNQLLKNNINYLTCVLSPAVEFTTPEHKRLYNLAIMNIHRECYRSIKGFAYDEFKKKVNGGDKDTQKVRRSILRTLNFGIALLGKGIVDFAPVTGDVEIHEIDYAFEKLDFAYENTVLPDKPLHSDKMMDWLLNIRMQDLCENI
ncbi:nucleotidyltransferase domain-containing protein [Candidatus Dependentiae bacterium]|nr:nucleotidyltransferase domain-containing protein [Candidatus Dependentiae bacterium]